jgi:hypothetical protein
MATDKTITITASVPIAPILTTKVVTATVNTPTTTVALNEVDKLGVVIEKVGNLYVNLTGYGEEAIPSPTLVKYNQDLFNAIETFRKNLLKPFTESKSISDLSYWLFSKNQLENITTIEVFTTVTDFNRPLLEVVSTSERRQFEFYKPFFENASILEHISISPQKLFLDSSTVADLISKVISPVKTETLLAIEDFQKHVFKVFLSNSLISDLTTLHPNKGIVDIVNLGSFIEVLSFEVSAVLLDTIFTTDDVLGNANIDDDQYAFVQKRLIENTTLIETITTLVSFLRSFDENIALSDLFNLNFFKNEYETSNISETINKSYSKLILDSSYSEEMYGIPDYVASTYAIDTVSTSVNKGAVENLVTSDLFFTVVDFNRFVDQVNSLADEIVFNSAKVLTDNPVTNETISFAAIRILADGFIANDSLSNSSTKVVEDIVNNITDVNYFSILPSYVELLALSETLSFSQFVVYSDLSSLSDTISRSSTKNTNEVILTSEYKLAHVQDYFASNYVAIGYVGSYYTI